MRKILLKSAVVALAGIGLMAGSALATPMLTMTGASGSTIVIDNGSGDITPTPGIITWSGSVDGWDVSNATGSSAPALEQGNMHLNANVYSQGAGTITFSLFEDGFTNGFDIDGWLAGVGYSTGSGSTVTYEVRLDGVSIFSTGDLSGLGGSWEDASSMLPASSNYSLELIGTITHTEGMSSTSFDAAVAPVPEPATMLLFGTGLVGLVGVARRRKLN